MPRYNVQNNEGKWACFSSIVDDFITDFMSRAEYQAWREKEYGIHCGDIEDANLMDYDKAMQTLLCRTSTNKGCESVDIPEGDSPCTYCQFWNDKSYKCEIVKRQDEVEVKKEISK